MAAESVLVTGITRGVGRAIGLHLAGIGKQVVGVYRASHAEARRLAGIRVLCADLSQPEGVAAVVAEIGEPLAGVVLNAGIAVEAAFEAEEVEGVDPIAELLRVDLEMPLRLLRGLLRGGWVRAGASVVFVSSNLARRGLAGKVAYSAAKAGLEGAVRGLARELGPRGIRVNAVAPGLLRTDMTRGAGEDAFVAYAREVPLRRVGGPEDIAPVVGFLLGEAAGYVTGQIVDVDGGWGC